MGGGGWGLGNPPHLEINELIELIEIIELIELIELIQLISAPLWK